MGPVDAGDLQEDTLSEVALVRTFLIADVRGYTNYTYERGDVAAARLAARFAEVVGDVVTAREGQLTEPRGDKALVVFTSARQAIRAAVDLQIRFAEEVQTAPTGLTSRTIPQARSDQLACSIPRQGVDDL